MVRHGRARGQPEVAASQTDGRVRPTLSRSAFPSSRPIRPATRWGRWPRGATGAYNAYFVTLAQTLVAAGESDAYLRLGWEFDGRLDGVEGDAPIRRGQLCRLLPTDRDGDAFGPW